MAVKLTTYDSAEDLASDAAVRTFMAEAFATEDSGYIAHALGVVARAKGMAQVAERSVFRANSFLGRLMSKGRS